MSELDLLQTATKAGVALVIGSLAMLLVTTGLRTLFVLTMVLGLSLLPGRALAQTDEQRAAARSLRSAPPLK